MDGAERSGGAKGRGYEMELGGEEQGRADYGEEKMAGAREKLEAVERWAWIREGVGGCWREGERLCGAPRKLSAVAGAGAGKRGTGRWQGAGSEREAGGFVSGECCGWDCWLGVRGCEVLEQVR